MVRDFLDEIIASRTIGNPNFPQMVQEAIARQDAARQGVPEEVGSEQAVVHIPLRRRGKQRASAAREGHKSPA